MIGILMGSTSDLNIMRHTAETLESLGVRYEMKALSAHRTPEAVAEYARSARGRGLRVLIAAAGGAAHLAGVVAAHTTLPVLGVPVSGSSLGGADSLYSMVQMPGGVPVGTLAVGRAGAVNAAILAVQILAVGDEALSQRVEAHKKELERKALAENERLERALAAREPGSNLAAALAAAGFKVE